MGIIPTHLINNSLKTMDVIAMRQEALADNITNIHTPNYKRKDVDFSQYLNSSSASTLETKLIDKFGSTPLASSTSSEPIKAEDELAKMQQNYMLFSVASRQLSSTITQIKTALNVSANG